MPSRNMLITCLLAAASIVSVCCDRAENAATTVARGEDVAAKEARIKELESEVASLRAQLAGGAKPSDAAPAAPAAPGPATAPPPAAAAAGAAAAANTATSDAAVKVIENPTLKGVMGRIVVAFPKGTKISGTRTDIYEVGKPHTIAGGYGDYAKELIPGKYDVVVTNVRLGGVEVKSRHDSVVPVGVLKINAADSSTRVEVFAKDGKTNVTGTYGSEHIGLPVGQYKVSVAGQAMPVEIKAGEATDF